MSIAVAVLGGLAVFLFVCSGLRFTGRWWPAIGQNWRTAFAGAAFTLAWLIHEGAFK